MNTRGKIWFWTLIIAIALASSSLQASAAEKQPPDGAVATVNGTVISKSEYDLQVGRVLEGLRRSGKVPNEMEQNQIRGEVLNNLIARELLYQETQKKGIKADEGAVDKQLKQLKGRFPTEVEYQSAMSRMNLTEGEVRSKLARDIAIQQLIEDQIGPKVTVSEEEIKSYYDSNQDMFKVPEQVRASHILIKVESQADKSQKDEARKKIEMVQQKLKKGEDFGTLAKEYSQGPSSGNNGDLGYFRRGQMVKPFEDAAFALKPGELSEIVETRFGYHLIKVTDRKAATTLSYAEVKDRLGQYIKQGKAQKELGLYVDGLRKNAKVETFLKESS
ncbi:MAG: peptidylprolyl isomerase [Syntrophobacterales bacterium]|jgi:peptidyl-prolyl cis-trans isomerase C